jgi:RimJ/RimL family protein N-acetyltransferase
MIEGKRTGLRAVEREDLKLLRDWRNNEQFRRHFREVRELSMFHQERWIEALINRPNDYMFIIVDLATNEAIGAAGILYINNVLRSGDFSFYIGKENVYIDQEGIALDAAQTLIRYGFDTLNLHKIWMELYEYDQKKMDFFTKELDFKVDGKLRDNCFDGGKYYDSYMLSLLEDEYRKG